MDIHTLTDKIQQNNPLDFGDIFNKSIDLFKKTWVQGFVFTLLTMVLVIPALLIIYIPLFSMFAYRDFRYYEYGTMEFPWAAMVPFFLLFLLVMIFINTLVFAMTAGFFKMIRELDEGRDASLAALFMYVKGRYLRKSFVLSLMIIGISILASALCYLPVFYVMVPLSFVPVIFAFNPELTPSEVIKASFKIGNKKWLIAFGLIIVSAILAKLVGLILCVIGVFFTTSFVYLPVYLMYKQVVGFEADIIVPKSPMV